MLKNTRVVVAVIAIAWVLPAGAALADPPGRAARLAYTAGAVSFAPAGDDNWTEARLNRPLWTGDRLWVTGGARAELQIGGAALRMAPQTSVAILNFDDRLAQFELTQGVVSVHVRSIGRDETIEIDTPNLALSIRRPGQYRIDVDAEATAVTVLSGEAEAFGTQAAYRIAADGRLRFFGTDLSAYRNEGREGRDTFDLWVADRVSYESRSRSAGFVAPELIGYADLDAYGSWRSVGSYGTVWVPTRVASDWAPYRYGHWAWIDPWGWTWIDDAPWGFAPFHYGRWAYVDSRYWAWVPGPRNVRPVYAPALVAFVGGDSFRLSISLGTSAVGWFPLAPGEIYRPAYTASRNYFTRVNVNNTVVNVTHVTNVYKSPTQVSPLRYANVSISNAVTAVPTQAFVQAQPVQRAAVRVDKRELERSPVVATAPVAPMRTSMIGTAPQASAKPSEGVLGRSVVARQAPPPVPPSIERRAEALRHQPGKPLDRAELDKLAPTATARPNVRVVEAMTPKPLPSGAAVDADGTRPRLPMAARAPESRAQASTTPARDNDAARTSSPPARESSESRPQPSARTSPTTTGDSRDTQRGSEGKETPRPGRVTQGAAIAATPAARSAEPRVEPAPGRAASAAPARPDSTSIASRSSQPATTRAEPRARVESQASRDKSGQRAPVAKADSTALAQTTPSERRPAIAPEPDGRSAMSNPPTATAAARPVSPASRRADPGAQPTANGSKVGTREERGEQAAKKDKKKESSNGDHNASPG